jgi:hypothetical protein
MSLVLWLARLLDLTSYYARRAADSIYRPYYRREARKSARAEMSRMMAQGRRDAAAAEDLIASTRPNRVGSPINRDR